MHGQVPRIFEEPVDSGMVPRIFEEPVEDYYKGDDGRDHEQDVGSGDRPQDTVAGGGRSLSSAAADTTLPTGGDGDASSRDTEAQLQIFVEEWR